MRSSNPRKPELLAPAGNLEKCRVAFLYGADAVYVGGKEFSLRAYSENLDDEELAEAVSLARSQNKKIYVTVNIYPREADIKRLPDYLNYLNELAVDGVIVSDPGVILLARRHCPAIPIHLSTQANTTNSLSALFWQYQGIARINLAREITFQQLVEIRRKIQVELEVFIHGAMCVSYSGRCLLSAALTGRSANLGLCTQPCRWFYHLLEPSRPNQLFPIIEDARGTYIFNSKDLCLIEELGKLMSAGVDAFKVEGRMKGPLYLATVVRTYRQAIDRYWSEPERFVADPKWLEELDKISHRPYGKGFLFSQINSKDAEIAYEGAYVRTYSLAGIVRPHPRTHPEHPNRINTSGKPPVCIETKYRLEKGMELEFLYPDGQNARYRLSTFQDLAGNIIESANPNSRIQLHVPFPTFPYQVVRLPIKNS